MLQLVRGVQASVVQAGSCSFQGSPSPISPSRPPLSCRPSKFEVRPDEAATLEADLSPLLSPGLRALMFNGDFKKHCQACELLVENMQGYQQEVSGGEREGECI
jgi:hypothetical protein